MTTEGVDTTMPAGNLMAGKRGLIMGVANNRSIAWGIAKAVAAQGAQLAFTYQGDALKKRVEPLAGELGSSLVLPCDVTDPDSVDLVFSTLEETCQVWIFSFMPSRFPTRTNWTADTSTPPRPTSRRPC